MSRYFTRICIPVCLLVIGFSVGSLIQGRALDRGIEQAYYVGFSTGLEVASLSTWLSGYQCGQYKSYEAGFDHGFEVGLLSALLPSPSGRDSLLFPWHTGLDTLGPESAVFYHPSINAPPAHRSPAGLY